jgi:hypothetical protein
VLERAAGRRYPPLAVALRHMPYGTEFYIRDPDGYILGFIEPAPPESGQ